jgi:DoxX-like family
LTKKRFLNCLIAAVWLANGLFCKVLNLVPRHREIVARILGDDHAGILTRAIGLSEMAMAFWILSGIGTRLNAITQMAIIATMNSLEFILAPDLLLWGRFNALFAFLFILLIYYNEFYPKNKPIQQA